MRNRFYAVLAGTSVVAAAAFAGPAVGQPYGPGMMGGGYGFGYGMLHIVIWAVVLVAVVAGIVWLVRTMAGGNAATTVTRRSAGLELLEERYARGELNRDEYLQKKKDIQS